MNAGCRSLSALLALGVGATGQWYSPPAGIRPAKPGLEASILPGGRVVSPLGDQYATGAGAAGFALDGTGQIAISANTGPGAGSITVLEPDKGDRRRLRHILAGRESGLTGDTASQGWSGVSGGVALASDHAAFIAEGPSGRISLIDWRAGRRRAIELDGKEFTGSHAADLTLDPDRKILYAADQANGRVAMVDTRSLEVVATVRTGGRPISLALSPDRKTLYVAAAASRPEPGAVTAVDVSNPASPKVRASAAYASPAAVLAAQEYLFVSDDGDDTVSMRDPQTLAPVAEIALRIPGLEALRGVRPAGMAFQAASGNLLVAEAGINAVGVIDARQRRLIGHLPAGWRPTRVAVAGNTVWVANSFGRGSGPCFAAEGAPPAGTTPGSVSVFPMPEPASLARLTAFVLDSNGFTPRSQSPPPLPAGVRHVVWIVKGSLTFDLVLGDVTKAANGPVMAAPQLARFGSKGYVDGRGKRFSFQGVNLTPNHHSLAQRWAFSDNFYSEPGGQVDVGALQRHLEAHGVTFLGLEEAGANQSAHEQATGVMRELDRAYVKAGAELPRFLLIRLPQQTGSGERPDSGHPYAESFLVEHDYELGRLVEYLSHTPWWDRMAVLVSESGSEGIDHIDARRSIFLCAGPWCRRNYVSHRNASVPGLLKTAFRLLGVPPMGLADAAAADLSDLFAPQANPAPYRAAEVDRRLFVPPEE